MSRSIMQGDVDPIETKDWLDSIDSVIQKEGINRVEYLIKRILKRVYKNKINILNIYSTDYVNTIDVKEEYNYPGDLNLEKKICSVICWNSLMLVLKASKKDLDLGGHIASFQSASIIYEVGFNHFFKAENKKNDGDLIYFQGHISPGIYARAFLEGRLTEIQMNNFRQEVHGFGLSSYPHPRLMPKFWQFPTVSMGLGAISSIYQAKFLKYLQNRGLKITENRKVYVFLGDGEMDEPESKGAIQIASRDKLDNLIFIINCNLQRLDGPVFGNGKIINELENIFNGAGWNVIKVLWGKTWDDLLSRDTSGKLIQLLNETLDGDYQNFRSKDGSYIRKHFFGRYPETSALVRDMSDKEIEQLECGGHDFIKVYSAFKKANESKGKATAILVQTVKGYGMGIAAEGKNIAHQVKKINFEGIRYFRDRFNIEVNDDRIEKFPFVSFDKNSKEYKYLHRQRKILGGYLPKRVSVSNKTLNIPILGDFQSLLEKQNKKISTTISFVRILKIILKNNFVKDIVVPIIADEARTFGMEGLFRQIGIYNSEGQKYVPQDYGQITYYKEDIKGQILQEGINELGAAASWLAAATSYSTNNFPMIPFYIYYSMFGFQRIGDFLWAAGDQQARGFLIGGTSGRTTLNGEGLQHGDGHSHIYSLTIPSCVSYDPAYAYELAVIISNGLVRMYKNQEDIYYYITVSNENYHMPKMPEGVEEGICKGIYKFKSFKGGENKVQLLGSGSIMRHVCEAGKILFNEYNISSDIYSVTSFTELARDGQTCKRWNMLHPSKIQKIPYVSKIMNNCPAIVSTDYMKLFAEQIRPYIPTNNYVVLGTDGFGRSDSRENLRNYFEISVPYILVAALWELSKNGKVNKKLVDDVIKKYDINPERIDPILE